VRQAWHPPIPATALSCLLACMLRACWERRRADGSHLEEACDVKSRCRHLSRSAAVCGPRHTSVQLGRLGQVPDRGAETTPVPVASRGGRAPGQVGVVQRAGDVHLIAHVPVGADLALEHLHRHIAAALQPTRASAPSRACQLPCAAGRAATHAAAACSAGPTAGNPRKARRFQRQSSLHVALWPQCGSARGMGRRAVCHLF